MDLIIKLTNIEEGEKYILEVCAYRDKRKPSTTEKKEHKKKKEEELDIDSYVNKEKKKLVELDDIEDAIIESNMG
jgi:hypothetical protein